jgi:hypothetical protein
VSPPQPFDHGRPGFASAATLRGRAAESHQAPSAVTMQVVRRGMGGSRLDQDQAGSLECQHDFQD